MEFSDIATIIQTGGHSALMVLLWFVYMNWRTQQKALETLNSIAQSLELSDKQQERLFTKIDQMHTDVSELPLNIMRVLK